MESKMQALQDFCKYLQDTGTEINQTDIDDYFAVRKVDAYTADRQLTIPVAGGSFTKEDMLNAWFNGICAGQRNTNDNGYYSGDYEQDFEEWLLEEN